VDVRVGILQLLGDEALIEGGICWEREGNERLESVDGRWECWHRVWEISLLIDTLDATPRVRYADNASLQDSVEETASRRFFFDK